ETINTLWATFEVQFAALIKEQGREPTLTQSEYADWFMTEILADSLGYAGTEMIRRTIGLSHVADLESIEDAEARAGAERVSIEVAQHLIKYRSGFTDMASVCGWISSHYKML
ncbi:MAG: S-methyl-5-thioribose kinase, partial [Oceanospirillaceae bacterium]|nr:S-methyl-5-thioribose kinase [Oceanospirillaceae bacterium]